MDVAAVAQSSRTKRLWRLIPYLGILYFVAFLDRVNTGYAALTMNKALHFNAEVFGFGSGLLFLGYFLLEIPGSVLVERWSARLWIARIMISWGIIAALTGFVQNAAEYDIARFLLGLAEAGFFPGIIVYLTHWFRAKERAAAISLFMVAIPISSVIGAPISTAILGMHAAGLQGWQWLYIIEGIPAVILGIVTVWYMPDWPKDAQWLTADEKSWIQGELDREREVKSRQEGQVTLWQALAHREVLVLAASLFLFDMGLYGLTFFLPTIVKGFAGMSNTTVGWLLVIPYLAGAIAMVLYGRASDRAGKRRIYIFWAQVVAIAGLLLAVAFIHSAPLALVAFTIANIGVYSFYGPFFYLPTSFLAGTAAAGAMGWVNSLGNLGGFVGPFLFGALETATGNYIDGLLMLALAMAISSVLILTARRGDQALQKIQENETYASGSVVST